MCCFKGGGESSDSIRAQFSSPVAGGRCAVVFDDAPASRTTASPSRRMASAIGIQNSDYRPTSDDWTDGRPIIHLGWPAPTPPLIRPVARIRTRALASHACCTLIGPWLPWRPRGRTTSAKGQSGMERVQERWNFRQGASPLNKAVANSERACCLPAVLVTVGNTWMAFNPLKS